MDAKSRVDFINSVASGQKILCPVCDSMNESSSGFCIVCGTRLKQPEGDSSPQEGIVHVNQDVEAEYSAALEQKISTGNISSKTVQSMAQTENLRQEVKKRPSVVGQPGEGKPAVTVQPMMQRPPVEQKQPMQVQPAPQKRAASKLSTAVQSAQTLKKPQEITEIDVVQNEMEHSLQEFAPAQEITREPISAFAQGLPAWSIVPPQTVVRRKKKS